jgi:hypothetical protein
MTEGKPVELLRDPLQGASPPPVSGARPLAQAQAQAQALTAPAATTTTEIHTKEDAAPPRRRARRAKADALAAPAEPAQ